VQYQDHRSLENIFLVFLLDIVMQAIFFLNYFFLIKYIPVRTQTAARIKKINVIKKIRANPAAIEKNIALTKQHNTGSLLKI
jgi:hypothetical protein